MSKLKTTIGKPQANQEANHNITDKPTQANLQANHNITDKPQQANQEANHNIADKPQQANQQANHNITDKPQEANQEANHNIADKPLQANQEANPNITDKPLQANQEANHRQTNNITDKPKPNTATDWVKKQMTTALNQKTLLWIAQNAPADVTTVTQLINWFIVEMQDFEIIKTTHNNLLQTITTYTTEIETLRTENEMLLENIKPITLAPEPTPTPIIAPAPKVADALAPKSNWFNDMFSK